MSGSGTKCPNLLPARSAGPKSGDSLLRRRKLRATEGKPSPHSMPIRSYMECSDVVGALDSRGARSTLEDRQSLTVTQSLPPLPRVPLEDVAIIEIEVVAALLN